MSELAVNASDIRKLAIKPNQRPLKVIDDGTPYWKLEKGCLFVRCYSFSNSDQLNGWVNLGRSDRYDLSILAQPLPLWFEAIY